ncbi:carboxymuconolactone decarboxylase family protein [Cyclobacterium qasimii]|uniref:Alkylhydroperoxidase AhpD core n=2 Tax=Cyclobacterium qasimii TaxID=1350429 RepID=S7WI10_9BACT|nr:carboxymuconolactone decarboxylase family protein [Cyclobacterium qasimii]EPR66379.1 Alkylhydroperoxidase AhpD core [Cyclobacterium qasimii M12-11B]GEO21153.1 alkyl hydroperoxide reductase AhpD [Cyclobacterium qasimii]
MTTTAAAFKVPARSEVSESNQAIFDQLGKQIGFVPNLYAFFAKNETALPDYLALQGRKTSLKAKEKELVNLVTSQINGCRYCQSAHTALGKMNGFSHEQILEIRGGSASFDEKLDALVKFTAATVSNHGKVEESVKEAFFAAGYNEATLIDVVILIGDKIMSNYLHNLAGFEIDFPLAPEL